MFRLLIGEYQHPPLPEHGSMLGARPASVNGHAACTTVCCLTGYRCSLEEPLFQNLLKGAHGALLHVGEHQPLLGNGAEIRGGDRRSCRYNRLRKAAVLPILPAALTLEPGLEGRPFGVLVALEDLAVGHGGAFQGLAYC